MKNYFIKLFSILGIFSFQIITTFGGNGSGNENHDFNPLPGGVLIIFVLFMALLYFKIIPILKKYFEKKKKKKLTKGKESIYEVIFCFARIKNKNRKCSGHSFFIIFVLVQKSTQFLTEFLSHPFSAYFFRVKGGRAFWESCIGGDNIIRTSMICKKNFLIKNYFAAFRAGVCAKDFFPACILNG